MIKGGNFDFQQQQMQQQPMQQQPMQQQPMQQQQPGIIGTALNDINANQNVLNPIYETTATIGIVYNVVVTIVVSILFGILIYVGFYLKNVDINKSENILGKYKNVKCREDIVKDKDGNNKTVNICYAEIVYSVDEKEYIKSYKASKIVNENQPVTVYYDPNNPNDFIVEKTTYYFGLGMIIVGFIIIGLTWLWLILSIAFKPIAAASGVGAIGDAIT
tara:strand:+ start:648 stop:1301 length:654 start_codon:yes stop_codon:yes gene_type:complete